MVHCCSDYYHLPPPKKRFPGGSAIKNPPAMKATWVPSPGQEDPLEKDMATHSSILARRIPWTEEPGGLQSMGSQRVRHEWSDRACPLRTDICLLNMFFMLCINKYSILELGGILPELLKHHYITGEDSWDSGGEGTLPRSPSTSATPVGVSLLCTPPPEASWVQTSPQQHHIFISDKGVTVFHFCLTALSFRELFF